LNRLAALVVSCAVFSSGALGQDRSDVVVDLDHTTNVPGARVRITGLLSDPRFLNAMRSGFPLYIEYRVELRETRANWFDRTVARESYEYVVLYDPVRETFVIEDLLGREELSGEIALRRRLETIYGFQLNPDDEGEFYYSGTVHARTLSDEDVDEVFDWLKGDDDTTSVRRRGIVTRSARRLLVQVAPLPRLTKSAQSRTFRWP
jgi:hypothetical protein